MRIEKGEIVRWNKTHVRLLGDVEVSPVEPGELHQNAGRKSWKAKTVAEKREQILKMVEARKLKKEEAEYVMNAFEQGQTSAKMLEAFKASPVPDPPSTVDESKTKEDSKKPLGQVLTEDSIHRRTEKEKASARELTLKIGESAGLPPRFDAKPKKPKTEEEWADLDWEQSDKTISKITGAPLHEVQQIRKDLIEAGRI